jgi:DNA-directed RNA polymerase specialized sigma24 family protein
VSEATQVPRNGYSAYATHGDFCRIFSEKMDRLYLLALLLTADAGKAEQCLVAGIGDSVVGNRIFKEWAYSWARRTVIQQAIRMIEPAQERLATPNTELVGLEMEPRLRSILKLDALERFVFVISVLEGYSYQDCSILLGCSRKAIVDARARALEQLANGAEIIAVHGDELQDIYSLASYFSAQNAAL